MKIGWLLILGVICTVSCTNTQLDEKPLATAFSEKLYASDLAEIFPEGSMLTHDDSTALTQSYINQWIRNKVIAQKAEENLSADEKDVQLLLDEYRSSLLIYRYQQKLIEERLDTNVTEAEKKSYFEKNKENFEMNKNIVQLKYVKMNSKKPSFKKVVQLLRSSSPQDKIKLQSICLNDAENFYLDDETWLDLDDVKKEIPIQSYNDQHFLQSNKFLQIMEGESVYLIVISDYKTQQGVSSYEFEKDKIRDIILQQRKVNLMREMENALLNEAIENKNVSY